MMTPYRWRAALTSVIGLGLLTGVLLIMSRAKQAPSSGSPGESRVPDEVTDFDKQESHVQQLQKVLARPTSDEQQSAIRSILQNWVNTDSSSLLDHLDVLEQVPEQSQTEEIIYGHLNSLVPSVKPTWKSAPDIPALVWRIADYHSDVDLKATRDWLTQNFTGDVRDEGLQVLILEAVERGSDDAVATWNLISSQSVRDRTRERVLDRLPFLREVPPDSAIVHAKSENPSVATEGSSSAAPKLKADDEEVIGSISALADSNPADLEKLAATLENAEHADIAKFLLADVLSYDNPPAAIEHALRIQDSSRRAEAIGRALVTLAARHPEEAQALLSGDRLNEQAREELSILLTIPSSSDTGPAEAQVTDQ